ncbi:MAG: hypothetical protein KDJ27_03865 [Gammaproteobacteria bacterium]|nr:hypothetical protein [Gammaproteobacteria bacterium]
MSNAPSWAWTQAERDAHRNTKKRCIKRDDTINRRAVNLPGDVDQKVLDLQQQFKTEHGLDLSYSAALASLIRQAPAWPKK